MVLLDKYLDEIDDEVDLPPSYDTIASVSSTVIDEKPRPPPAPTASTTASSAGVAGSASAAPLSSSTWFSLLPNVRTKQTRQTIISLIRDLVATTTDNSAATPILASCASALPPSSFSALLQQPILEGHTPIYWAILNRHTHILPDMLQYAGPLNNACVADIRLACLASGDQLLFGKLRRGELPFITTLRADALVLGSTSADDIDVHEVDGEAAFSASIKIRLWQKRMRVAGLVGVEFIARGRIWSLTFFSSPSPSPFSSSPSTHGAGSGPWQVALSLMEHSPPTFVDGRLIIDVFRPLSSSISDLLSSESSSPAHSRYSSLPSTPVPTSPTQAKPSVIIPFRSTNRLAHRTPDGSVFSVFELGRGGIGPSSQKPCRPPQPATWSEEGTMYTNTLIGVLGDDLGWGNTPYLAPDGTLHARLDARLEKAEGGSCIIC
ncbi:uncharacterized protein F5891DRAFT_674503 [Suillus fuscotomentosus]|uniref:Uncharacterized protein n=1 Tax=Suillus fuscotomentosus TaxID=1912939 RepID=A0AAD4HGG5_9AGAM|nr:uncharacterized protein F5891DRAFT_674503 [Suillus fuscotomentosus]KAG1895316.1 hypothetical protein F5891DRAFT_674503 [Suillus fuscotomentosus]